MILYVFQTLPGMRFRQREMPDQARALLSPEEPAARHVPQSALPILQQLPFFRRPDPPRGAGCFWYAGQESG